MMASGKSTKSSRRSAVPVVAQRQGLPWLAISAIVIVLALVVTIFIVVFSASREKAKLTDAWAPSESNPDPSTAIPGIFVGDEETYKSGVHVDSPTRVAYDRFPPIGGPHDSVWADCNGVVYPVAVRNENMVHTLEHGAIWIAYNPETTSADELATLRELVEGQTYISMSPYPNLETKISLQAWRHQLALDSVTDERIAQFITALKRNLTNVPEPNGTCSQPSFNVDSPPPFVSSEPGADAVQMNGTGGTAGAVVTASNEGMTGDPASTATPGATTQAPATETPPAPTS
jgi:hypothetical protein